MTKTAFAGIENLPPGAPLSTDGYAFQGIDRAIIDQLLRIGAVTHRHDAHAAMADPALAPVLGSEATGGSIPAGQAIYITYTLTDGDGGETLPVAAQTINMPAGFLDPSSAPGLVVDYVAGNLLASNLSYAVTVTDGQGGETALGPVAQTVIVAGHANAEVTVSGLTAIVNGASGGAAGAGWRLWRQQDGGPWYLVATGAAATDGFVDGGAAGDCTVSPPLTSTTQGTGVLRVTVPGGQPAAATQFNIYASLDGSFTNPALLGFFPIADAGVVQRFTTISLSAGAPPSVSLCKPGANQINPDTDILQNNWKRAVANFAALPGAGNADGDIRETLDTHHLYAWNGTTNAWVDTSPPPATTWKGTVANFAALPGAGNTDGDVRLTLDTHLLYVWNATAAAWAQPPGPLVTTIPATQQAGNYTLALADAGTVVEFTDAAAVTCTIPAHATVAFPVGTILEVYQAGAGTLTVAGDVGVTLQSVLNHVNASGQYGTIRLRQTSQDVWVLTGDLA